MSKYINGFPGIQIDTREKKEDCLKRFKPFKFSGLRTERALIETGDYGIIGFCNRNIATIEVKMLGDFLKSISTDKDRFDRELDRMSLFKFKYILIIMNRTSQVSAWKKIISCGYAKKPKPKNTVRNLNIKGIPTINMHKNSIEGKLYSIITKHKIPIYVAGDRVEAENFIVEALSRYWYYNLKEKECQKE